MKLKLVLPAILLFTISASAQNRPFKTELPWTVGEGNVRAEVGVNFFQDVTFRLSGLRGDLTEIGILGLRQGLGKRAELQLFWTSLRALNVHERFGAPNSAILDFSGNSTSDVGNMVLGTKVVLIEETDSRPLFGFRFAVELPNGSTEQGLSTDETNFRSEILVGKRFDRLSLAGNAGLAILGDPLSGGAQDDLFTYGLAALYRLTSRISLLVDWNGRAGPGGIGTEEKSELRIGSQIQAAGFRWDLAAMAGLLETDPSSGFIFGVTREFDNPFF